MHAEPQIGMELSQLARLREVQAVAVVAIVLTAVLGIFWPTFAEMAAIWHRSSTFAHGYLVLPAFLYLVWTARSRLAAIPVLPWWPAYLLAAAVGSAWLLGELASALTPSFFAVVALIPIAIAATCGWRWAVALAFPLAFLFFAVPFGEVFVPTMMEWTADFAVKALQWTAVPVYREGQHIVIPSGRWAVVEACSGIRYLIASMFVGALYGWLMFRSARRRLLFFAASIIVPIVANWMRAYVIIMLGHLSGNRIAVGVDHIIYGWIFFGVVMFLLFSVAAIWREDGDSLETKSAAVQPTDAVWLSAAIGNWRKLAVAGGAMLALLGAWPITASHLTNPVPRLGLTFEMPAGQAGWSRLDAPLTEWRPELTGALIQKTVTYDKGGRKVGAFVGLYRDQRQGAELVNSMNQLVSTINREWILLDSGRHDVALGGAPTTVRTATLHGIGGSIVAWRWYWLGDSMTVSDARAKLDLAFDRLHGRDDTSAWVTLYVVNPADAGDAERVLEDFAAAMGGPLTSALQSARLP